MRQVASVVTVSLLFMFLVGLVQGFVRSPALDVLLRIFPGLDANWFQWIQNPYGEWSIVITIALMVFPLLCLSMWWQERRVHAGDYTVRHDRGEVTISEVALKRFVRAVSREIPNIVEEAVETSRSTAGLNIDLRVKVDRADAWPYVKNELLRRVPEEMGKLAVSVNSVNIALADFTTAERGFERLPTAAPAPVATAASTARPEPPRFEDKPELPRREEAVAPSEPAQEKASSFDFGPQGKPGEYTSASKPEESLPSDEAAAAVEPEAGADQQAAADEADKKEKPFGLFKKW